MNDLERFLAVVRRERPDYMPIFGFPGAPGMSRGCQAQAYRRLVATGMPPILDGLYDDDKLPQRVEAWFRYWGTTGPEVLDFALAQDVPGFAEKRWIEGDFEWIASESGALTRQVLDNDHTYSMPEFIAFPVRDRASWEFYRERMTPRGIMPPDEMEANCRRYDGRTRPLTIGVGGPYGFLRGLMGPTNLSYALYDQPDLVHDMVAWRLEMVRTYVFPLLERLRPEVVTMGEDLCYNHGMLLSPAHFHAYCGPHYTEVCRKAREVGAALIAVDTDGNVMEYAGLAHAYGVNAIYPCEVHAGNDLFALRERLPQMTFFGWLEKESVNEGNRPLIRQEILTKVPPLLSRGGYFPNGDHGIQPLVTFEGMCRFMTLLHEVTGNPEGQFPRMDP